MIINKAADGVLLQKYFLRTFLVLVLFIGLGGSSVRAHEHCDDCVGLDDLLNHQALFYELLVEALQGEGGSQNVDQAIRSIPIEFAPPKVLFLFKQNLKADPVFQISVERAFEEYNQRVRAGGVPHVLDFDDVQRAFFSKALLGFQGITANAGAKISQYGLLFGIGWAAFELVEHSITPFLPPGLGFLCATFPVFWSISVGPFVEPIQYIRNNPNARPLPARVIRSIKLPLKAWKLGRSLHQAKLGGLKLRRRDQEAMSGSGARALGKTVFWPQALQSELGLQLDEEGQKYKVQGLEGMLSSSLEGDASSVFALYQTLSLPIRIQHDQHDQLDRLFATKAFSYAQYLRLKFTLGKIENLLENIYRSLLILAEERKTSNQEPHERELSSLLADYLALLGAFQVREESRQSARVLGIDLKSPKKNDVVRQLRGDLKALTRRVRAFKVAAHLCSNNKR